MRINLSTILKALALIAQDVLDLESQEKISKKPASPSELVAPTDTEKPSI